MMSAVEVKCSNSSVMLEVVSAHTAASSANRRLTAWRKLMRSTALLLKCLLSSHSSFFSHQVADWPFFSLNNLHKAKSGLFSCNIELTITKDITVVSIRLNEIREAKEASEYSVEVLREDGLKSVMMGRAQFQRKDSPLKAGQIQKQKD